MSAVLPGSGPTGFGGWWEKRQDPTLLHDERTIILAVGQQVAGMLNQAASDIDAEAAERAALQVTKLDIDDSIANRFTSLERLPGILDAPLIDISVDSKAFNNLTGVEAFPTLTGLSAAEARLTDIQPLGSLGALQHLDISANSVVSLAPLADLVSLQALNCAGNQIATLEPLRKLVDLQALVIGGGLSEVVNGDTVTRPFEFLDNPLDDASVLADLPLLANILTRVDRLSVDLYDVSVNKLIVRAQATRVGRSNRFIATDPSPDPPYTLTICSMVAWQRAGVDPLWVAVHVDKLDAFALAVFDTDDRGVTTRPDDPSALFDKGPLDWFWLAMGKKPTLLLDCRRLSSLVDSW